MKKVLFLTVLFTTSIFYSCNKPTEQQVEYKKIQDLESKVYNDSLNKYNTTDITNLIVGYTNYTKKYKEDTLCPKLLFKAGELSMQMNLGSQAISYFKKIEKDYSTSDRYPYSIFLQAFVYETQMNNIDKAKEYYQKFIQMFPNHDLTDDAEASIANLGKSLDEIIKGFEEKNNAETSSK